MINNVTNNAAKLWANNAAKKTPSLAFELPAINNTPSLTKDALVSSAFRVPNGGFMSASVFTAENFSPQNPVMIVRGIDVCGTPFEKEININDIDPRNASFVELLAFDGFSAANGKPSMTARIAARAVLMQELNGKEFSEFNAFTQMDFVSTLRGLTDSLHTNRNYETLLWVNSNVEHFFSHFNVERQT
jgi:hypothetical protein